LAAAVAQPQTSRSTLGRSSEPAPSNSLAAKVFPSLFGLLLGLSLLKFGNPPIMEKYVSPPADIYEFLLGYPWPINWAYRLLIVVTFVGLFLLRRRRRVVPQWILALPLF